MTHQIGNASISLILLSLFLPALAVAQPQGIRLPNSSSRASSLPNSSVLSPLGMPTEQTLVLPGPEEVSITGDPFEMSPDGSMYHSASCQPGNCCCAPAANWLLDWRRAEVLAGVVGFSGAADYLSSTPAGIGESGGNFGFQEGFNFGSQLPTVLQGELGVQLGLRFTHTNLDGSRIADDNRNQLFLTTGLFRRVDCGLQGGLVVDYLHDDWLYQADLLQLRGELSWLLNDANDFGFRFTDSCQTDDTTAMTDGGPLQIQLASLDTYRFFYRHRFGERGEGSGEWQVGFTEDSQALLGMKLDTRLSGELGLQTTATYVIPDNDTSTAYRDESWNLGVAVVWTPGRCFGSGRDYYRPLFDVADNGSMFSSRK